MGSSGPNKNSHIKNMNKLLLNKGLEKLICIIKNKGYGFLCQLPVPNSKILLPVLITSSSIIGKNEIENEKKVEFILNDKQYSISIDDSRKRYINEEKYNITIIEIKKDDGFQTELFLKLEDDDKFSPKEINSNDSIGGIKYNNKEKNYEFVSLDKKKNK